MAVWLTDSFDFPPVETADADGLLAIGGGLEPERLLAAYRHGIFPWFNSDDTILWWSPDPRMVLFPNAVKVSKSMRKIIRDGRFALTKNKAFDQVIKYCGLVPRQGQEGTWITKKMREAYTLLHKQEHVSSYEVWQDGQLVGGLYGVDLGHVFCGESMFSLLPNASKFALIMLAQDLEANDYALIDCQVHTDHLASMGATPMPRTRFVSIVHQSQKSP